MDIDCISIDKQMKCMNFFYRLFPHIEEHSSEGKTYRIDHSKINSLLNIIPLKLDKVRLEPSKIHGRGVFAKKKILKGELITFYPGDIVEYTPNGDRQKDGHVVITCASDRLEKKFGQEAAKDRKHRPNDYAYAIDPYYTMSIGHPFFDQDPCYMGHFINDGAKSGSTARIEEIYFTISLLKQNCQFYNYEGETLHVPIYSYTRY